MAAFCCCCEWQGGWPLVTVKFGLVRFMSWIGSWMHRGKAVGGLQKRQLFFVCRHSMTVKRLQSPQHDSPAHGGGGEEHGEFDAFCPALAEMQPRPYPAEQDQPPRRQEGLDLHPHVRVAAIVVEVGRG